MAILSDLVETSDFDQYDVFLSFRGPDTRTGFTNYLYRQLIGAGVLTFRDNEELIRGEGLEPQLDNAIKQSSILIIVFSQNYASSPWCLNELVRILEQKDIRGVKVIPIFYKVDASEVRHQKGSYEKAFAEHKEKGRVSPKEIEAWKEALKKAADLSGFSSNEYDDELIDKVLREVIKSLPKLKTLGLPEPLLGMNYRAYQIHSWFKDGFINSNVLLICGIGGIGKSTIAKYLFNEYYLHFDGCSFLVWKEPQWDEKEACGLQSQLLSNILNKQREETIISDCEVGIKKIKRALYNKKVLLVLDDVSESKQLDALLGIRQEFCPGSKILITTRNEFLANHFIFHPKVHNLENLNDKDSLKLLSLHAFRQDHPPEEYKHLSVEILLRCEGLPLALILLGSALYKQTIDFWEKQLQKWDEMLESSIHKAMKISYESLEDDKVKSLFLHVACILVGKEKDYILKILDGCGLHATVGMRSLIQRCLVTIDDKKVMVHRVVQDMGREIVRLESPDEPGERSRLWYHEDSFNVLKDDKGTKFVKGLILDGEKINKEESDESSFDAADANPRSITKFLGYVKTKKEEVLNRFIYSKEGDLNFDAFAKMVNLELIKLNHVLLTGSCTNFPKKLRWICWHGFPQDYIPMEVPLEKLIAFDLRHSLLKQVWKGYKEVKSLLFLDLSYSLHLYTTPDFRGLKQLERLILRGCSQLVIVGKTIGILEKLVLLDLRDCKSLRDLPRLPNSIVTLELSGCDLGQFSTDQENAEAFNWKRLVKFSSSSITRGPVKLLAELPHHLVNLVLVDCNLSDECFPRDFSGLSSLEQMDLSGNLITRLPDCVGNLSNSRLRGLTISYCRQLQSVINPPNTLTDINLFANGQLRRTKFRHNSTKLKLLVDELSEYIETEGCVKVVLARNVDRKVIKNLGFESLLVDFTEVRDEICICPTCLEGGKDFSDIKVKYEFGIFSTCIEGREIPSCFTTFPMTYVDYGEGDEEENWNVSILYTIPSSVANKIEGLNICVATATIIYNSSFPVELNFDVTIYNKTKDFAWTYKYQDISYKKNKIYIETIWVSTWKCMDGVLEGGDEIEVSFHIYSSRYPFNHYEVKECGIRTIYEEDIENNETSDECGPFSLVERGSPGLLWTDEMNVSFSNYRIPATTYFLLGLCTSSYERDEFNEEETNGRSVGPLDWWGVKQDWPSTKGPQIHSRL